MLRRGRRFARDERGAVLVEFGLVVPLFLLMFCAMLDFAFAILTINALSAAVREGGRFAAVIQDVTNDDVRVQRRTAAAFNAYTVRGTIDSSDVDVIAPTVADPVVTVTIPSSAFSYEPFTPMARYFMPSVPMGRRAIFRAEFLDP